MKREMHMEPKLNVTMRQVLNDLAFTAVAALATGATVGGIAFVVFEEARGCADL